MALIRSKSELPFVEKGFGQVEPNRLSSMVNGEMESQAPAVDGAIGDAMKTASGATYLENGRMCILRSIDAMTPASTVAAAAMGRMAQEPKHGVATDAIYMVYSERKVYDERLSLYDFADYAESHVNGFCYPRLFKLTAGDIFTTNCINEAAASVTLGSTLYVGDDGYLCLTAATNTTLKFKVTKVYTMPDGQVGVKLLVENNM